MEKCIIHMGSVTLAMKGREILRSNGLSGEVIHTHGKKGCGYGLQIDCNLLDSAQKFLRTAGIVYDLL